MPDRAVKDGRYVAASEVAREGPRLVEKREAERLASRATPDAAAARGGGVSDEELDEALAAKPMAIEADSSGKNTV